MPNLKFRLIYRRLTEIPKGYRLATVEDVRKHFNTISSLGIPPLVPHPRSMWEGEVMLLLDGYMTYHSRHDLSIQQTSPSGHRVDRVDWKVVVKEKEWDGYARTWITKSSACYSRDGIFLRKQLYHHISLPEGARQIALHTAWASNDLELLYWLLTTISSEEELERFKRASTQYYLTYASFDLLFMECLLSKFPFQASLPQLPHEVDSIIGSAIKLAKTRATVIGISVVDLLVESFSDEIVHCKNSNGKSLLDMAENEADKGLIHIFTKLLSASQRPLENHISSIKPRFQAVLLEAVERGYVQLVEKLLDFKGEMTIDASFLMRVLRETARRGSSHLLEKLFELYQNEISVELAGKDEDKITLFSYAAESGDPDAFKKLLTFFGSVNMKKIVDEFGKTVLHWAAQGKSGHQIVNVVKEFTGSPLLDLMQSRDEKGRTPFHIAVSKGNKNMVDKLLGLLGDEKDKVAKYAKETDYFGVTPLKMACRGGHRNVVKVLLDKAKCDPLKERDANGKTALHYAVQAEYPGNGIAICQQLLASCGTSSTKSLLLWASAGGVGTADEVEGVHPSVKTFLQSQKKSDTTHLLRAAARQNNVEMAWEVLNRGADIDDLRDPQWEGNSDSSVLNVLRELELLKDQARDQPSTDDKLGRNVFAEGLAALFLNRFIESPITVGICGEWGMGKSSLMIQTEKILLMTAAQLTFPNMLGFENFVGSKKVSLSTKGRKIYQTIRNGACSLFVQEEDRPQENAFYRLYHKVKELEKNFSPLARHGLRGKDPLVNILQEYQPQYHAIYKSLACMDSYQLLDSPKRTTFSQLNNALREVPRILTIRYNAWHYRDESEAWAGLAVAITKEIENSMTRAQWFSTRWRYTRNKNNINIYFQVFLPCFMAFLAGWIAWVAWIFLKQAKFKKLLYGSIPLTIIAIVWIALQSVMSLVKPVSVQMLGYITSPDHTNRLGYQEQVISDINFLKTELGKRPHWFFSFLSGEWCCNWFGLYANNVENSSIPKFNPASKDQLRIITFVDDLDRCEEKVILKVLSAINLVLATCKINVVMGIDKKMIERAIRRSFEDVEDIDVAEKFLCKIIQIPLSLPDPTEDETNKFLEYQLGHQLQNEISSQTDDIDYGTTDEEPDEGPMEISAERENNDNTVLNIPHQSSDQSVGRSNPSQTRRPGIIKKAGDWLMYLLKCSNPIASNISSELEQREDQSSDQQMCPLAFSEGARLTREMLISKYSEEEARTFDKLKGFATGNQKLPREWKRLFNYHKLTWNILSKRGDVQSLPTWKVELVVWIFVCWQWKHEMNTLIKGWSKFASIDGQSEDGSARGRHGPRLSQIVKNCVHELENSEKSEAGNSAVKKSDDFLKGRGRLRQEKSVTFYVQGDAEGGPSYNSWNELEEALQIQDVSMKGIQLFQQFRLHCETDHLPWPVKNKRKVQ